jgi:hypothetical protein
LRSSNTEKKQPTTGVTELDEYRNHAFDRIYVDRVDNFPHFPPVTLGKGH